MVRTPKMVESTVSVADNVNHCGLEIAEKSNFVPAVEKDACSYIQTLKIQFHVIYKIKLVW